MSATKMPPEAVRVLTAVYRLANGEAGVVVDRGDIAGEIERVGLFTMSDKAFGKYLRESIALAKAHRAAKEKAGNSPEMVAALAKLDEGCSR